MSQFEYIMVMAALIMALALAQALRGLTEIITSRTHNWPHTLWLIALVFIMIQSWWADWDYNALKGWQFTTYLSALSTYIVLFAQIHLLLPATRDVNFDSRAQFGNVRTWFFALLIIYILLAMYQSVAYFGTPLIHPYRIFQVVWIIVAVMGLVVRNEKVQIVLPILLVLNVLIGQITIRLDIGALMAS